MPIAMAILGLLNGIKSAQSGNLLGGAGSILGVLNSGLFNSTPNYNNTLGDFGVKRNFM